MHEGEDTKSGSTRNLFLVILYSFVFRRGPMAITTRLYRLPPSLLREEQERTSDGRVSTLNDGHGQPSVTDDDSPLLIGWNVRDGSCLVEYIPSSSQQIARSL